MKKLIFAVMAIIVMAAPIANAQKANKEALVAKLAKVDADSQDAKKAAKGATWLARGNAYLEAAEAPSKDIFLDMDYSLAAAALGRAMSQTDNVNVGGVACTEYTYPMLKVYVAGGKINGWIITSPVKESDLAMEAANSFVKAGQVDAKLAAKVNEGLEKVKNYYSTAGTVAYKIGEAGKAAEAYMAADKVQNMSGFTGQKSGDFIYNAGLTYVMDGEKTPASFAKGAEALTKALEAGYADENGNIYYYLFHAYYGQKDSSVRVANMQRAKQVLMEGMAKFPANTRIIEGLISIYTDPENPVGDPSELVAMVDGALAKDPQNKDLWNGRAIMFNSMKNFDEAINSFAKVVELDPKDAQAAFNLGLLHIYKADSLNEEMSKRDYKSNAEWKADQDKVIASYKNAVPVLEAAYELNPNSLPTVETLKVLTFRLRDEEGMMPKYEKYNKLYEEMKAQQNK